MACSVTFQREVRKLWRMRAATFVAILMMFPPGAIAQGSIPFTDFKTFRCEFTEGEGRAISEGRQDRGGDAFSEPLIVDNVNYTTRTARLVGNVGADVLTILRDGRLAITFVEYTDVGGVITFTIFKQAAGVLNYRAVMSRHLAITIPEGSVTMTQHYGTCRGLL